MIDLEQLSKIKAKLTIDINEFAEQIASVQPMPDNLIEDIIDALDGRALVITAKEPKHGKTS